MPLSEPDETGVSLEHIVEELRKIEDSEFSRELLAHLDRMSLHKNRNTSFEDVHQLFNMAFRYAQKNLNKKTSP